MSGETIEVWGVIKTLEGSGFSIANGALMQADDASYDKGGADGNGYPDARFVLKCSFTTAPVENSLLSLYARELAVDGGTAATDVPETTRPGRFIGSFVVNNTTLFQYLTLMAYDLPPKADYYVHNNGTGQAVDIGWKLTVQPRSYKAAP